MVFISMGIIFLVACKNDMEEVKEISSFETFPTLEAEDVTVLRSDSGQIVFRAETPLVQQYSNAENPYKEFPRGLKIKLMDKEQNVTTKMSANYAIHKEEEEKWIARHDVEIIDKNGRIINTEYMVFDMKKGKIYSDQFTKFTETDATIYGNGFESNMNLSNARILEPTGFLYFDEEEYKTQD